MAYQAKPLLFVEHNEHGYASSLDRVYTNGKIVRSYRGHKMSWLNSDTTDLAYALFTNDGVYEGYIVDKTIASRILEYIELYYGKRHTNCSSFAYFMSKGEFIECERANNLAVVGHGMRPFKMAHRVDVGDIVWIAYAEKRIFSSRRGDVSMRKRFLEAQKQYHANRAFSSMVDVAQKPREPGMILDLCKNPALDDYHFMVCVGHERGQPLWLFQNGYHNPSEGHNAFGMTVGMTNPYPAKAPLYAYIKKRRTA